MEKLIELLNEYEQENLKVWLLADKWEFDWNLHYYSQYQDELVFTDVDLRIISARYGFIKWLVDNDKIDWTNVDNEWETYEFSELNKLIMLLSIQDSPVEFLCEILR